MNDACEGALAALDWGTSSLRAALIGADGSVLERRSRDWGIMSLPAGGFDAAYAAILEGWNVPAALACGMVGSAQGWVEAPYVDTPAGPAEIAASLTRIRPATGPKLFVVPGVLGADRSGAPNVMRGEETQIAGALLDGAQSYGAQSYGAQSDDAESDAALFVLPGTHSKWVHVAAERITGFETFMTGELFGVLRSHSILGRALPSAPGTKPLCRDAFARGLVAARASHEGVAPLLFATRALVLTRQIRADESLDYLSGLLIGDELRAGLRHAAGRKLTLIGAPDLIARYRVGLDLFGAAAPRVIEDGALTGLLRIARAAGLLRRKEA